MFIEFGGSDELRGSDKRTKELTGTSELNCPLVRTAPEVVLLSDL